MNSEVDRLAKTIWDYHHLNHKLEKADAIFVMGSHDLRVAERGAELFLEGWAPLLIFSGDRGYLTEELWDKPEADVFADVAISMGVPENKILVEDKSTNTGDNVRFTRQLLQDRGINLQKFIIVQKPYMERRAYATFKKLWPGKECIVTSPRLSYEEDVYGNKQIPPESDIHALVGDLQRIKLYPKREYQMSQEIPKEVWDAYEKLVAAGYTDHLIK